MSSTFSPIPTISSQELQQARQSNLNILQQPLQKQVNLWNTYAMTQNPQHDIGKVLKETSVKVNKIIGLVKELQTLINSVQDKAKSTLSAQMSEEQRSTFDFTAVPIKAHIGGNALWGEQSTYTSKIKELTDTAQTIDNLDLTAFLREGYDATVLRNEVINLANSLNLSNSNVSFKEFRETTNVIATNALDDSGKIMTTIGALVTMELRFSEETKKQYLIMREMIVAKREKFSDVRTIEKVIAQIDEQSLFNAVFANLINDCDAEAFKNLIGHLINLRTSGRVNTRLEFLNSFLESLTNHLDYSRQDLPMIKKIVRDLFAQRTSKYDPFAFEWNALFMSNNIKLFTTPIGVVDEAIYEKAIDILVNGPDIRGMTHEELQALNRVDNRKRIDEIIPDVLYVNGIWGNILAKVAATTPIIANVIGEKSIRTGVARQYVKPQDIDLAQNYDIAEEDWSEEEEEVESLEFPPAPAIPVEALDESSGVSSEEERSRTASDA